MYEHLRNDLMMQLANIYSKEDINKVCAALDIAARNYEIKEKETSLVLYEDKFPQVAKIYIASKKLEGLSENSLRLYSGRLKIFFETLGKDPERVTTNDIRMFLALYQQKNNISDRTLDKFRQIINGFYTWLVDEEYIAKNPCRNINNIKFEVAPRKALTRLELERLRRACTTQRDIAIIDVLYSTGCRVSELCNMKKSDMDSTNASIHIIGKGKKHNICYFNTNAQLSLDAYLKSRDDKSDYLFVAYRKPNNRMKPAAIQALFRRLASNINIQVTPHIIRHTSATLALQSGMELTVVQKMLGHADINTTRIYAETLESDVKSSHIKYVI